MLYGPDGRAIAASAVYSRPQPQPEAEERVRAQLKEIDRLLDVKWFPNAIYNDKHRTMEGRYGLICTWPPNDPRYADFQKGLIEECFDMLGWFCEDIHDAYSMPVAVDSIERKVIEVLGKCDGQRMPHTTRMKQIIEKNAKVRANKRTEVTDRAQDMAHTLWNLVGKTDDHKMQKIMQELSEGTHE